MKWWRRHKRNGVVAAAEAAATEQVELAKAAERMTPVYHRLAPAVANLPPEEFAERVRRAFGRPA